MLASETKKEWSDSKVQGLWSQRTTKTEDEGLLIHPGWLIYYFTVKCLNSLCKFDPLKQEPSFSKQQMRQLSV